MLFSGVWKEGIFRIDVFVCRVYHTQMHTFIPLVMSDGTYAKAKASIKTHKAEMEKRKTWEILFAKATNMCDFILFNFKTNFFFTFARLFVVTAYFIGGCRASLFGFISYNLLFHMCAFVYFPFLLLCSRFVSIQAHLAFKPTSLKWK